jgi:uncharacterized protein YgfB (UPF0149 family)
LSGVEAAGWHGALCGRLAWQPLQQVSIENVLEGQRTLDAGILTQVLYDTRTQLEDLQGSFALFLPEDHQRLDVRTVALADWCDGFLYGMGLAGKKLDQASNEVREILKDFAQISQAVADGDSEDDEAAFVEVAEYVRTTAQVVYLELRANKAVQKS